MFRKQAMAFGLAVAVGLVALVATFRFEATMGAAVVLFLLWLVVRKPGMALFVCLVPYALSQGMMAERDLLLFGGVSLSQVFMIGVSAMMVLRIVVGLGVEHRIPPPTSAHVAHFAFFVWTLLTCLYSPGEYAWISSGRVLACVVAHYYGYWLGGKERRWVPITIGTVAIIAGVSAAIDAVFGGGTDVVSSLGAVRASGSFGGPVSTATVAFVGVPVFVAGWVIGIQRRERALAVLGFVGVALAVVFTLTRTLVAGIVVFGVAYVLLSATARRANRLKVVLVLAPVVLLLGSLLLAPSDHLHARAKDLPGMAVSGEGERSVGSGRGMIWRYTLVLQGRSSAGQWFFGHGTAAVREDLYQIIRLRHDAHNSYIEVLYDLGILGVILFMGLLGTNVLLLKNGAQEADGRAANEARLWAAYFIAFCLSTIMFNGYVFAVGPRWFTYLGIGYALGGLRRVTNNGDGRSSVLGGAVSRVE